MPITHEITEQGHTVVKADGLRFVSITAATPQTAVQAFLTLCATNADLLCQLTAEYEEKRQWNHDNYGKGRNWPVFGKRDKLIAQLCKQAGIVDS